MAAETQDRWTEIRRLHVDWKDGYRILGGVVLVGIGVVIGAGWFANPQADGYTTNLYTEFISIGVTVFILDFLNRRRDDRRRIEDLKAQLLRQVRSPEPAIANHAIHEMREHGWLTGVDGLLKEKNLSTANLSEAILRQANLRNTKLIRANLTEAKLDAANLQEADLSLANLKGAYLIGAKLEGANLHNANLEGANLTASTCSDKIILPDAMDIDVNLDGTFVYTSDSYYKPGITDMTRYTDPAHPDFWQPEWARGQGDEG